MARANDSERRGGARGAAARSATRRPTRRTAQADKAAAVEPEVEAVPPEEPGALAAAMAVPKDAAAAAENIAEAASAAVTSAADPKPAAAAAPEAEAREQPVVPVAAPPAVPPAPAAAPPLLEGGVRLQRQMIAFGQEQVECGLAAHRAAMASRSLPALLALQTEFAARSLQSALTHGLALARLAGEMLRDRLRPGPAR